MGKSSVSDINAFTIAFPNATQSENVEKETVDRGISFYRDIRSDGVSTLSPSFDSDPLGGLLYVPTLPSNDTCNNASSFHVPSNVTRLSILPSQGFDYIAIAPWTSGACAKAYLDTAARDQASAVLFYLPDRISLTNQTAATPPDSTDSVWHIDGSSQWQSTVAAPAYGINANEGSLFMGALTQYSKNIKQAPSADALLTQYGPTDNVRLYCNILFDETSELPSLWVFLLVVMGMLAAMVFVTSLSMHLLQRHRRRHLRQLITSGQVDLPSLGIALLTVPRDMIDTFPLFVYQTGSSLGGPVADAEAKASGLRNSHYALNSKCSIDSDPKADLHAGLPPASTLEHRSPLFPQPTCPICLDDFIDHETIVRSLPCNHIFHPACIDPMLLEYSTLCPLCKASALPAHYCPPKITNAMLRQHRAFRARRSGRARSVAQPLSASEPAPAFSIRSLLRRTASGPSPPAPAAAGPRDLELRRVTSRSGRGSLDTLDGEARVDARPPSMPRGEWARHRASALFGRPARTSVRQDPVAGSTPRC